MKKLFIILFVLSLSLFGHTTVSKLRFESGITIYGQVGFVDLVLTENFDDNTYEIKTTATSIGMVKYLTKNRRDIFVSKGNIKDGVYVPSTFTKETLEDNYRKLITYTFNYKDNKVEKEVYLKKYKILKTFDRKTFKFKTTKKLIEENDTKSIKLYPNDYLSLYLNMKKGNLKIGKVSYVDKKEKDSLFYRNTDEIEVQKQNTDDKYKLVIHHDQNSMFFKKVESINVSYYGDAYIEKVSEIKETIDNPKLAQLD